MFFAADSGLLLRCALTAILGFAVAIVRFPSPHATD